jgi:uncharacterized Zn-binding protein involved in type VI secretion
MSNNVARGDAVDTVASEDGSGFCCGSPTTHATMECSDTVFVNGIGVVRQNDQMVCHPAPIPCCDIHCPGMVICSIHVFVEQRGLARKGDIYIADGINHVVSSGSADTFDGSPQGIPEYS